MKKLFVLLSFILLATGSASAQMSDRELVEYLKTAKSTGLKASQISEELLSKGVKLEQVEGIKSRLQSTTNDGASSAEQALSGGTIKRKTSAEVLGEGVIEEGDTVKQENVAKLSKIFGHDIFSASELSFEPNENLATPQSYQLGPGDEIEIDIWGDNESSEIYEITPEGRIFIELVGPVQLSGLTVKAATDKVKRVLKSRYAKIDNGTSVSLSLISVRTIQVNIMGEVSTPGTYRLSAFSSLFSALYRAGGVSDTGSLRSIKIVREGRQIALVDVYGYLFDGKSDSDISLKDGDIIIVPPYVSLVEVTGNVKRPMKYELRENETLGNLFKYAGGFTGNADRKDFCVVRHNGNGKEISTVPEKSAYEFVMADGDSVSVGSSVDRFSNKVDIRGCVFRPGSYQLGGSIATARQLVLEAGGVKEDAFLSRAVILREKDDLRLETVSFDLGGVMDGTASDVLLKNNDLVVVSSIHELEDMGSLTIVGEVMAPGEYAFSENTTVEDLIIQAGGLLDGASLARIDVSRRVSDVSSTEPIDDIAEFYTFPIKESLAVEGGEKFYLRPYDIVSVRRSPSYVEQRTVTLKGEVVFPGEYSLVGRDERISDLIARAGGLTKYAYARGARLQRKNDTEDDFLSSSINSVLSRGSLRDSLKTESLSSENYLVATDLELALKHPGSSYDLTLKEGDEIVVPEFINTVRIDGEVMFPTAVVYKKGMSVKNYINNAGGYTQRAKRSRAFIVYADGHAVRAGRLAANVEPGSVVIIPARERTDRFRMNDVMAIATSTTSLVTMMATVTSIIDRL